MPQIQLTAAIVMYRGHVLIVQRSLSEELFPGLWEIPTGQIENGETPQQAVLRQLQYATGIEGHVQAFVGTCTSEMIVDGKRVRTEQRNFIVYPRDDNVLINSDHFPPVHLPHPDQESNWIPIEQIEEANLGRR